MYWWRSLESRELTAWRACLLYTSYLVKIAVTMAFCFLFVTIFSILFGNENSIVGVVVLLCLMVFRNADLGIHTGQSTMLLALFFVIMTVCPHLANQFSPVLGMLLNIAALAVLIPVSYTHLDVYKRQEYGYCVF